MDANYKIQSTSPIAGGLLYSNFTLVPLPLYQEENKDLWLNFLNGKSNRNQIISQTHFSDFNCVLIYENEGTHIIEHLLQYIENHEVADSVFFAIDNEIKINSTFRPLFVLVIKNKQIEFANIFSVSTPDDTLYYLLSVYQQLHLEPTFPLSYITDIPYNQLQLLKSYFFTTQNPQ